jgi:hypothetical protein
MSGSLRKARDVNRTDDMGEYSLGLSQVNKFKTKQVVEKDPSASFRSTASLQRTAQVRLRSACPERAEGSVSRAPRTWDLFDRPESNGFSTPCKLLHARGDRTCRPRSQEHTGILNFNSQI